MTSYCKVLPYIYIYIYIYIYVHLFNCLIRQIANQPITWQKLNAFRHLDEERGFLVTLNVEWSLVPDGPDWVFQKLQIYWDIHTQPFLGLTEYGQKKRKYIVSGSCVDKNTLLMSEVRGEWADSQITTRYNQGMQNTISERTTRRTLKQMGRWATAAVDVTPCTMSQSSNHLRLVSWTWQWVYFTQMASTVTRSQSSRAPFGCGGTGD